MINNSAIVNNEKFHVNLDSYVFSLKFCQVNRETIKSTNNMDNQLKTMFPFQFSVIDTGSCISNVVLESLNILFVLLIFSDNSHCSLVTVCVLESFIVA